MDKGYIGDWMDDFSKYIDDATVISDIIEVSNHPHIFYVSSDVMKKVAKIKFGITEDDISAAAFLRMLGEF